MAIRTECRAQWDLISYTSKWEENFRSGTDIHALVTNSAHEYDKKEHEGGTGILSFETISVLVPESATDSTVMVRWCWIKLKGNNGHKCRVDCACQPFEKHSTSSKALVNVYSQHIRYHRAGGDTLCTRMLFREKLVWEIKNGNKKAK